MAITGIHVLLYTAEPEAVRDIFRDVFGFKHVDLGDGWLVITDDPELRYTQSGAALAGFTVAVSHRTKKDGAWVDTTDGFFRCTAWRSVAENAAASLKKGQRVLVIGKLTQRNFETDGTKRSVVEIQVQHVGPDLQFATATVEKATAEKQSA